MAAAAFALLGGCALYDSADTTRDALRDAGHDVTAVGYVYDLGADTVAVTWRPRATTAEDLRAEENAVANVVWQRSPLRVEAVDLVSADGGVAGVAAVRSRRIPRAEMERSFGPRDAALDDESADAVVDSHLLMAAGVVGGAVATLGVLAIVITVRQSRRRTPVASPS